MNAEVTVLLPFNKSSATITDAVQSILKQTFQSWDLILIDNNADSDSRKIAKIFSCKDKRVKLIKEPIQGIAFALNTGIKNASAPLIARMDADDISHPDRLKLQFKYLTDHPEVGVISCRCSFTSSMQKSEGYHEFVNWQNQILSPEQHFLNRFVESPVAHPSVMFRKDLINLYGAYHTDPLPEDYELWLRWMEKGVKFAKLEEELLEWKDSGQRLSRTHSNYSEEAFFSVKANYLISHIRFNVNSKRKIIICGTGRKSIRGGEMLERAGIQVFAFTDVKTKNIPGKKFIPVEELKGNEDFYFVNFISKRGVGNSIRNFFNSIGFEEERDFILAG